MTKVLIVSSSFPYPEYKDGLAKINYNLLIRSFNYKADLLCIEDTKIVPIKDIKIFSIPLLKPLNKFKLLSKWLLTFKPFNVIKYELLCMLFMLHEPLKNQMNLFVLLHRVVTIHISIVCHCVADYTQMHFYNILQHLSF